MDLALPLSREGMLQAVDDDLAGDQAGRHRLVDAQVEFGAGNLCSDALDTRAEETQQTVYQLLEVLVEIDAGQGVRVLERFVDQGHGADAVMAVPEERGRVLVPAVFQLQIEQGGDHLHVVFHPVVDLLEHHLFFLKRGPQLVFFFLEHGDVFIDPQNPKDLAIRGE